MKVNSRKIIIRVRQFIHFILMFTQIVWIASQVIVSMSDYTCVFKIE